MENKPNIVEEIIQEGLSLGGNNGGPGNGYGSSKGNSGVTGSKTWSGTNHGGAGVPYKNLTALPHPDEMAGVLGAEEDMHKAPKVKPFPLETLNDHFSEAFILLGNAEALLKSSIKYNAAVSAKPEKKAVLKYQLKKVKAIRRMIEQMAVELDEITI